MTVPMIKSIGDVPYPIDTHSDAFSPLLTAGAALGITGNDAEESAWLTRTSGADGVASVRSIHGRTLRWNQLYHKNVESATVRGITYTIDANGLITLNGTVSQTGYILGYVVPVTVGHKYLACGHGGNFDGSKVTFELQVSGGVDLTNSGLILTVAAGTTQFAPAICLKNLGDTLTNVTFRPQLFDLTAMFGASNEPSTVAEFEALYPLPYYEYDAGSLLPVSMTGIESTAADESWTQQRTIPAGTLRGAGSVYDELTETERIVRVGERAYQSGDESDPTVTTDGTITYYPLTTPTVTTYDPPLNLTYRTEQGGTERVMVPTGEQSAPPTIVTAQGYTAESLRDAALAAIAPVENGTASTNYAVGSYLVHGGQLCRVTVAIATGESISIGTNVTATTVMAEVIALIAQ